MAIDPVPPDLVPADCPWPVWLGIDPGTVRAGWGALVLASDGPRFLGCGVLTPDRRRAPAERLAHLSRALDLLLDRLRPATVVVESAFAFRNVQSALRIGEARGLALAAAARRGLQVVELAPAAAKKAVLGNGAASKPQVAAMIARRLALDAELPEDASDALALVLAHYERSRFDALLRRSR